ncbi:MAG: hypothetical protein ABIH18_10160 [Candidatus Omnitrophota bacterium]
MLRNKLYSAYSAIGGFAFGESVERIVYSKKMLAAILVCRQSGVIHYLLSVFLIFSFFIFHFSFYCFAQDNFIYDAKGKRNPFIPLVTADGRLLKLDVEETRGDLAIEGIIYDEQGVSYAIVNGSVVKAGDIINNAQVLKIEKNKVILIKEGKELELELLNKNKED